MFLASMDDATSNAAETLVQAAGNNQHRVVEAYHTIGMRYLALGDRTTAAKHLRNAFERTAAPYWPMPLWSLAMAEHLERNALAAE